VLQAQVTDQVAAERYERTDGRQGYRNGSYPHQLTTRVGTLTLRVPRIRNGKFSTELFARYQRSEQALVLALMEMVVNGVSTVKSPRLQKNCVALTSPSPRFQNCVSNSTLLWRPGMDGHSQTADSRLCWLMHCISKSVRTAECGPVV
jgi:hypothetical protein